MGNRILHIPKKINDPDAYSFIIELVFPASTTFSFPFGAGTYDCIVDYGDGSAPKEITSSGDADKTHTYSAGTYTVKFKGKIGSWIQGYGTGSHYLTKIINWGNCGFEALNFQDSQNLISIPNGPITGATALTTIDGLFSNCINLNMMPENLLWLLPNITSAVSSFASIGYTGIVPSDLFKYNVNMVSFNTTFAYSKIAGIADGLFYYNNLAVQFQQTFIGCLLFTSLPNYLFSTSAIVTELNSTWYNCTGITSIPETLIKNATSLTSVYQCFRGIGITTIPVDLFRYNINISSFEIAFYGCNLLTSVPAGLFKYNIAAQTTISFYGVFNSCVKLQVPANIFYEAADKATVFLNKNVDFYRAFYRTSFTGTQGTAPDLWACSYGTGSVNGSQCYRGAGNSTTSLSNYASIPFTWK